MTTERIEKRLTGLLEDHQASLRGVLHRDRLLTLRTGTGTTPDTTINRLWHELVAEGVPQSKRVGQILNRLTLDPMTKSCEPPTPKGIRDSLKRQGLWPTRELRPK